MPPSGGHESRRPALSQAHESRISFSNRLEELNRFHEFLERFAVEHQLPSEVRNALDLAVTEWLTNVISYGFVKDEQGRIDLRLICSASEVRVEVVDSGLAFNPLDYPLVDISVPLTDKPIGGLGIHMIRSLMDRLIYTRERGKNLLTLIKFLPSKP